MKHVKRDKYEKKRTLCGSVRIYSIEYICAHNEIAVITTSILADSESNRKPQCISIKSMDNQVAHLT